MAINQFPLDPTGLPAYFLECSESVYDGSHQKNKDGVPLWNVSLLIRVPGQRPETLVVKVAATKAPSVQEMARVALVHPVATYWSQGDGRSGISIRADAIEVVAGAIPVSSGDAKAPGKPAAA